MNLHRTCLALLFLAAFGTNALAEDEPNAEPQYERPIYRLTLEVKAEDLDRTSIRDALASLEGVTSVDLHGHEKGLEAWITRDAENEIKKRTIKKALQDTKADLEEMEERWVRADGELLPIPKDAKELSDLKPKEFYVKGRTLLYRITTTPPKGEPTVTYQRFVYDDVKFQSETYMNLHWRVFHMDNDRKLDWIENFGGMQTAVNERGKTEDVETAFGKLECKKQPGTENTTVPREDGSSVKVTNSYHSWILGSVNLRIRKELDSNDGDGNVTKIVTELVEVG